MSFCCLLICWNLVLFLYKDFLLVLTMEKLESQMISYFHLEDFGLKMGLNLNYLYKIISV